MNTQEITQQLLQLENRDIVRKWFKHIHSRDLSANRAMEINSAARQSSEYLRNAAKSDYIVRPLLTFYGINSLTRALVLLLKPYGGENTLKGGHGLTIQSWNNTLFSGNIQSSLSKIGQLRVATCKGMFTELVDAIENRVTIHSYSSSVDWSIPYEIPPAGISISLDDLLSRVPDFECELENLNLHRKYCTVNNMSFNHSDGFICKICNPNDSIKTSLSESGYAVGFNAGNCQITCDSRTFCDNLPLFLHKYVNKAFGSIPQLFIVEPFESKVNFSEIAVCYMVAYILGMLVRYYPTHWIALVNSADGDIYWPILNRAQHYVEHVYPELVIELIKYITKAHT